MNTTHWKPTVIPFEDLGDDPLTDPLKAAAVLLEADRTDNDDAWEAWNDLERNGYTDVELSGFLTTTELITDEAEQFDGYEPGCEWFKATGEKMTVRVSLNSEVKK
jgi:hypothetical protein